MLNGYCYTVHGPCYISAYDHALICCFSDPLPPTNLEVQTASTTTDSVTVTWSYDNTESFCEKWKVKYKVKDASDTKELTTSNVNKLEMTIPGLTAGETYTISVFGVTTGDVISQTSVNTDATVSKYPTEYNAWVNANYIHDIKI